MSPKKPKLLSVIIPAYLQEKTIQKDLKRIQSTLDQIRYDHEIICVVDGKIDKTYQNAKKVSSQKLKVISYKTNKGKGNAVRFGMARSKGNYIAFIDSGMEIDPNGISMILEHMEWYQADIIVGSKRHPASQVIYPLKRKILSRIYQIFVRLFTGLNVTDTQVGLKIFRRPVLEKVLPRLVIKAYAFDVELLSVAHRLGFKRIYEAPVKLDYDFRGPIHADTFTAMKQAFMDTLAVIYRLRILRYYDNKNKRKWKFDPDLNFRVNTGQ